QCLVTAGVDDAIDRLSRAFLMEGDQFVLPSPTFEMLTHYVTMMGATPTRVSWLPGQNFPVEQVLQNIHDNTKLIVVISPNNPTGDVIHLEQIDQLAQAVPHIPILLDLAYVEFADQDPTQHALQWPNVIITRTFSKAWGVPGLRVGYALGHPQMLAWMKTAGEPFSTATPSLWLAQHQFEHERQSMLKHVQRIRQVRQTLRSTLQDLGVEVFSSQANYLFLRCADATWFRDAMAGMGIAVRIFPEHENLVGCVRITCPCDDKDVQRLQSALYTLFRPQAILFDMDGVLVDVSASYREAIRQTAASFGVHVDGTQIQAVKNIGNMNNDWVCTQQILKDAGIECTLAEVTERFEQFYQGTPEQEGLCHRETPKVTRAWLKQLKSHVRLGVVTGRPRKDAHSFLEKHQLTDLFDVVVCMEDAASKPSPEPLHKALSKLGLEHAWYVGDTPDDVAASRAAFLLPIGIQTADHRPEDIAHLLKCGASCVLPRTTDVLDKLSIFSPTQTSASHINTPPRSA
ncbi:MAG: TIGR01548 family HAD-type hydrolase, partial [Myxococcota bacterium]